MVAVLKTADGTKKEYFLTACKLYNNTVIYKKDVIFPKNLSVRSTKNEVNTID